MTAIERLRKAASGERGWAFLGPEDCAELLQEIDRLKAALKSISERKCRGGWGGACGEADSAAREAEYALEPSP